MSIKRYFVNPMALGPEDGRAVMLTADDGDFVLYADHEAALKATGSAGLAEAVKLLESAGGNLNYFSARTDPKDGERMVTALRSIREALALLNPAPSQEASR